MSKFKTIFKLPLSVPERDYTLNNDTTTYSKESYSKIIVPLFNDLKTYGTLYKDNSEDLYNPIYTIGHINKIENNIAEIKLNENIAAFDPQLHFENGDWFIGVTTMGEYRKDNRFIYDIEKFIHFSLCEGRLSRKGFKFTKV